MSFLDRLRATPEKPNQGSARGQSGRAHSHGFLDFEEFNSELRHPNSHRVYDRMYRTDGDVRQVISLVTNPALAGTWQVNPHGGELATAQDVEIARFVQWALFEQMSPNWLGHLAQFLPVLCRSGFAPGEKIWEVVEYEGQKRLVLKSIGLRLPRSIWRWDQSRDGELAGIEQQLALSHGSAGYDVGEHVATRGGHGEGGPLSVKIPTKDLVYYRLGAEGDNWEGVSLLRPAFKHWKMKDAIERLDAIAQEREAIGIPVLYPPASATDDQLDDLETMLQAMRTNEQGYVIMPGPKAGAGASENTGWVLELMGYDRSGSGRDPQPSLDYHSRKIAAAFISEFMRLGSGAGGSGSRATAQVQQDPFLLGVEALTMVVEQEANKGLVAPLVAYNFPNVKDPPKLQMSLVDSTSLTQLADYVLKLTQVGALLPDQELEDFLRARADLPPANPEIVKKRGEDEEKLRRAVMGINAEDPLAGIGGQDPDVVGGNDPGTKGSRNVDRKGASTKRKSPTGRPSGDGGKGTGAPRGPNKELATDLSTPYRRELRDEEYVLDLEAMESELEAAPQMMRSLCRDFVHEIARGLEVRDMTQAIGSQLGWHYDSGAAHVRRELGHTDEMLLARAHDDPKGMERRAALAASFIRNVTESARDATALDHDDEATILAAAEEAGLRAAERMGRSQGTAAFLTGRHDQAMTLTQFIMGTRYVSLLDRNTCASCEHADDGELRDVDDPVRQDRRPPNRHCHSTASGQNLCRCFEVYEPMPPDWDSTELDGLDPAFPPFMAAIVKAIMASQPNLAFERVVAIAVQRLRTWARGGSRISPAKQQQAQEALAAWADSQRA